MSGFVPSAFFPVGAAALSGVTPPAATSEAVASGGSVTGWTFSAFTDPDGRIASYSATLTAVVGSGSLSGSGLGPYSLTGTSDGDSYTVELDALDSDGAVLATATHSVAIAAGGQNYAPLFDGVDERIDLPASSGELQGDQPWTISVWFRESAYLQGQMAIACCKGSTNLGWSLSTHRGTFRWEPGAFGVVYNCTSVRQSTRWTNWTWCYDGSTTLRGYTNGVLTNTVAVTLSNITYTGTETTVGAAYNLTGTGYDSHHSGQLRHVAIWDSDQHANISDIYGSGLVNHRLDTITNPPDRLYLPLDEPGDDYDSAGGSAVAQDVSGNGYDGDPVNMEAADLTVFDRYPL